MKKNILKKFFIKLAKALDLELIDQNEFKSPTLDKRLNENLSNIKKIYCFAFRRSKAY